MSTETQASIVISNQFKLFDPDKMIFGDEIEISVRDEAAFCSDREEFQTQMNALEKLEKVLTARGYMCVKTKSAMSFETVWKFKKGGGE